MVSSEADIINAFDASSKKSSKTNSAEGESSCLCHVDSRHNSYIFRAIFGQDLGAASVYVACIIIAQVDRDNSKEVFVEQLTSIGANTFRDKAGSPASERPASWQWTC